MSRPTKRPSHSLILHPDSYIEPLDISRIFAVDQPLEVELGSGDGSFLVQYAKANPGHNFLGVERLLGRFRKVDRKAARAGLANLRLIRIEAGYFLEYMLPKNSVAALHVYFPDPWPKRRHQARRLITARFMELAARTLVIGGNLYLRTDDANYSAQMVNAGNSLPAFRPVETPQNLAAIATDFEMDFAACGVPIFRAAFQRIS